ncbi:membrane protein [soil metagenome]
MGQPVTPGWTPPPKPGLIPLRPLTLGGILGASFQVLRRNPRPTFGFALLVTGLIGVVTLVVVGLVSFLAIARTASAVGEDADTLAAGATASILLAAVVPAVLAIVSNAILQGVIALEVARGTVGEKLRLGGLWRAARGRIGALIGWSALITGAVLVAATIVALLIGLLIAFGGTAGLVTGVLLAIIVALGAVVVYAWLGTKLSLVPSILMLERVPLREAVRRSWSLTNDFFWRTFGIQILVAVILNLVASIIATPLQILVVFGSTLINPNNMDEGLIVAGIVVYLLTLVFTLVFGAIAAVVQAATSALIYIDLRMRKEGLDLELTRFVEARQAGDLTVENPYLVP